MIPNISRPCGVWGTRSMDNGKSQKNSFTRLKKDIMKKVLLIVVGSVAVGVIFLVFFVDGIFQDSFAKFMVGFFTLIGFDKMDANNLYFNLFMNKKYFWLLAGLLVIISIAFYITLSRFTLYFNEISNGVDELAKEERNTIKLSPELDFMEDKLNEVNDKLYQKERDAKEAEQRKNDLVVYLAHDIKTPLTSIVGYLNLLQESPDMPIENRAKYTDITLEKAYRLEELINEFFDITRFNLQTIVLEKTKVDIGLMLRQMTDEFHPSFEAKGLTVNSDITDGLIIDGDNLKLARVLNNVIKNAISYSDEKGSIRITAMHQNKVIVIKISNTGNPIPQDKLDIIFEKFYRLDQSRSTDKGGSGLGLAIAQKIIVAHGGQIHADSNERGTTFTIDLPA